MPVEDPSEVIRGATASPIRQSPLIPAAASVASSPASSVYKASCGACWGDQGDAVAASGPALAVPVVTGDQLGGHPGDGRRLPARDARLTARLTHTLT